MKKILVTIIVLSIVALSVVQSQVHAQSGSATLAFSPSTYAASLNQEFDIRVIVDTNGESINAITANFSYPSDLLEVVEIDLSNSVLPMELEKDSNDSTVLITVGNSGGASGYSGTGEVGTVTFRPTTSGTATLSFTENSLITSADTSSDVLGTTGEATISVGSGSLPAAGLFDKPSMMIALIGAVLFVTAGSLGIRAYFIEQKKNNY